MYFSRIKVLTRAVTVSFDFERNVNRSMTGDQPKCAPLLFSYILTSYVGFATSLTSSEAEPLYI